MLKKARAKTLGAKAMLCAFRILKKNNGEMPFRDLLKKIEEELVFDDWEKALLEKSGQIRWQSVLGFFSISCTKIGFLTKKSGTWYLTKEGLCVESKNENDFLELIATKYNGWQKEQDTTGTVDVGGGDDDDEIVFDVIQAKARGEMIEFTNGKNPYEFQDLVAALLRGMGYYTPFVAPKGKDGGVDVVAYNDPLGTVAPRIKVQIKHRENTATVKEIRELIGLVNKAGDVGLFVSTGGFTSDAKSEAKSANVHIELMDQEKFIELWQKFYDKLSDIDKSLFPLKPIYFLNDKQ
jgi:restriction system protein